VTDQSDPGVRVLRAAVSPAGAVVRLPCGAAATLTRQEIALAWAVKRVCGCGAAHSLVPMPDHALALVGSEWRNKPGTVVVLLLAPMPLTAAAST
jgi:hypothetical protein